jgi:hypothetical protein
MGLEGDGERQRLAARSRVGDVEVLVAQGGADRVDDRGLVVDDQDPSLRVERSGGGGHIRGLWRTRL